MAVDTILQGGNFRESVKVAKMKAETIVKHLMSLHDTSC